MKTPIRDLQISDLPAMTQEELQALYDKVWAANDEQLIHYLTIRDFRRLLDQVIISRTDLTPPVTHLAVIPCRHDKNDSPANAAIWLLTPGWPGPERYYTVPIIPREKAINLHLKALELARAEFGKRVEKEHLEALGTVVMEAPSNHAQYQGVTGHVKLGGFKVRMTRTTDGKIAACRGTPMRGWAYKEHNKDFRWSPLTLTEALYQPKAHFAPGVYEMLVEMADLFHVRIREAKDKAWEAGRIRI